MDRQTSVVCILAVAVMGLIGCNGNDSDVDARSGSDEHLGQARRLVERDQLEAAMQQLEQAVVADPYNARAYTIMGDLYRHEGNLPAAKRSYERACKADPAAFRPCYNLGVVCQGLADLAGQAADAGDYLRQAVDAYIEAITIKPASFEANMNLGACYFRLGEYYRAEQYTRRATEINPTNHSAWNNLGVISELQGRPEEAIAAYKNSIELEVDQPNILLNLGSVYMRTGKLKLAMNVYQTATRQSPQSAAPWQQMGVGYFRLGMFDKSIRSFQEAIRRDPRSPGAYRGFGVVCMYQAVLHPERTDLRQKALKAWRVSLKLQPNQPDLAALLERFDRQPAPK
ncbi:MAG: tetratricopeptide repeat protein [Planctomycetes bacterium]|nr:tetratricopeptide repeat protein [Phycisphaerae bacterium]NBB94315.1 tetratricopeptide repeat protein [Planctomycetota bacterium]